jgi:hypothetical protein
VRIVGIILLALIGLAIAAVALLRSHVLDPIPAVAGVNRTIDRAGIALSTGLLQSKVAIELCACHFVSGLPEQLCLDRSNTDAAVLALLHRSLREADQTVTVAPAWFDFVLASGAPTATAGYDRAEPRFGCRIMQGPRG